MDFASLFSALGNILGQSGGIDGSKVIASPAPIYSPSQKFVQPGMSSPMAGGVMDSNPGALASLNAGAQSLGSAIRNVKSPDTGQTSGQTTPSVGAGVGGLGGSGKSSGW